MEPINNRMRELRKALGMSQLEFGEILHISKSGVCDLEAGRRKVQDSHIVMLKTGKKTDLLSMKNGFALEKVICLINYLLIKY